LRSRRSPADAEGGADADAQPTPSGTEARMRGGLARRSPADAEGGADADAQPSPSGTEARTRGGLARLRRVTPSPPPACSEPGGDCAGQAPPRGEERAGLAEQPSARASDAEAPRIVYRSPPPPPLPPLPLPPPRHAVSRREAGGARPPLRPLPSDWQDEEGVVEAMGAVESSALIAAGELYRRLPAPLRGPRVAVGVIAAGLLLLLWACVRLRAWQRKRTYRAVGRYVGDRLLMDELSD